MNIFLFLFVSISNIVLAIVIMCFVFKTFKTKGMSKEIKAAI